MKIKQIEYMFYNSISEKTSTERTLILKNM